MWPFRKVEQTLLQSSIEKRSKVYQEGKRAGLAGAECWENPCEIAWDGESLTQVWHEGWYLGRQERASGK